MWPRSVRTNLEVEVGVCYRQTQPPNKPMMPLKHIMMVTKKRIINRCT